MQNSSFGEESSLVGLSHTLVLITTIQDLCITNKSLNAVWKEREPKILTAVRDLTAHRVGEYDGP